MYYSQQDLDNITKQFRNALIILLAILLGFIVISVFIANLIANKLGMVVMVVGVCITIFLGACMLILSMHIINLLKI